MHSPNGWPKRFSDKVSVGAPNDCWEWKAVLIPGGYGQFWLDGKMRNAHRAALTLSGVEIPHGHVVMHSCDNRKCCNPNHLSVAMQRENMKDMARKQRAPIGSAHGCAILSEDQVAEILLEKESALDASVKYGVSRAAIYDIRERRSWRHVRPASR